MTRELLSILAAVIVGGALAATAVVVTANAQASEVPTAVEEPLFQYGDR